MIIKLYEKKESLESMILGINKDPYRVNFHAFLEQLNFTIEKEVLADADKAQLYIEKDGVKSPFDSYPNAEALAAFLTVDVAIFDSVAIQSGILQAANTTRIGNCCGVGEDIYMDPNEDN